MKLAFTLVGLVLPIAASSAQAQVDILGQAEARTERVRTGEVVLRLVGP